MDNTLEHVKDGRYAGSMPDGFFKALSLEEQRDFRQWVRDNYTPGGKVDPLWHPVVRDECRVQDNHAAHRFTNMAGAD